MVFSQMLHEQVRTYKRDLHDSQASNTARDRHIMRLQAEMKRMHEALQVSSVIALCNEMTFIMPLCMQTHLLPLKPGACSYISKQHTIATLNPTLLPAST